MTQLTGFPSITRELVFEMANQAGFETAFVNSRPEDLAGCEVLEPFSTARNQRRNSLAKHSALEPK